MKITRLIEVQFKSSDYRELKLNSEIERYEKQGFEFVSVHTAMAATGANALIGAAGIVIVTMQREATDS